jgi:hypothetical protein
VAKSYNADVTNPSPALSAGETVSINSGATVTITNGTWAASGAGAITINDGKLRLQNASTTVGWKFALAANNTSIGGTTGVPCAVEATGNWISIGTGNGQAGQTATHWDADYCPCVWVETGSGTGVYEKYLNLSASAAGVAHTVGLSNVGAGKYGRYFTQSGATLTFGGGANGKCPPNGANIRVPNLIITYIGATSTTSLPQIQATSLEITLDTVQMSRAFIYSATGGRKLRLSRCDLVTHGTFTWGYQYDAIFDDCGWAHFLAETNPIFKSQTSSVLRNWLLRNCAGWNLTTTAAFQFIGVQATFEDCDFHALATSNGTSATSYLMTSDANCDLTVTRGTWVGGAQSRRELREHRCRVCRVGASCG